MSMDVQSHASVPPAPAWMEFQGPVFGLDLEDAGIDLGGVFLVAVVLFLVQLDEVIRLVDVLEKFLEREEYVLYCVYLCENRVRFLLVSPKIGLHCLLFKL